MLYFFGYADDSLDPNPNSTGFFKFDAETDRENHHNFNGFKTINDQTLEMTSTMTKEELSAIKFCPLKEK